jgi:hypothetical protein
MKKPLFFLKTLKNPLALGAEIYKLSAAPNNNNMSPEYVFLLALQNAGKLDEHQGNTDCAGGVLQHLRTTIYDAQFITWKYEDGSAFVCFREPQGGNLFVLFDLFNGTVQFDKFPDIAFGTYDVHSKKLASLYIAPPSAPAVAHTGAPPAVPQQHIPAPPTSSQKRRKKDKEESIHTQETLA